jgi:hypothetical protein
MQRHLHRHRHDRGPLRGAWHTHPHAHAPVKLPLRQGERLTLGALERRLADAAHRHRHRRSGR